MRSIRVTFDDGDTLETDINGTDEEIRAYYLGVRFNLGDGPNDRMATAVSVEFLDDKLFIGVFPGGLVYCDRSQEVDHDYKRVAFLPYDTLELRIDDAGPLLERISAHAATIQAKRGEQFKISTCGQTVLLGGK